MYDFIEEKRNLTLI